MSKSNHSTDPDSLARAFEAQGTWGLSRPGYPMGWLPQELAGDARPVVIPGVIKHGARNRKTMYYELVLISARENTPARLVLTNLYTGHSEAWNLPEGMRLTAQDDNQENRS